MIMMNGKNALRMTLIYKYTRKRLQKSQINLWYCRIQLKKLVRKSQRKHLGFTNGNGFVNLGIYKSSFKWRQNKIRAYIQSSLLAAIQTTKFNQGSAKQLIIVNFNYFCSVTNRESKQNSKNSIKLKRNSPFISATLMDRYTRETSLV